VIESIIYRYEHYSFLPSEPQRTCSSDTRKETKAQGLLKKEADVLERCLRKGEEPQPVPLQKDDAVQLLVSRPQRHTLINPSDLEQAGQAHASYLRSSVHSVPFSKRAGTPMPYRVRYGATPRIYGSVATLKSANRSQRWMTGCCLLHLCSLW